MRKTQGPGDHRLDDGTVIWLPDWMTGLTMKLPYKEKNKRYFYT
jgi:hypothetical protein